MKLDWKNTGVQVVSGNWDIKAFTFAGCLMTVASYNMQLRRSFIADDGKKFNSESEMIKYMDKKYKKVETKIKNRCILQE